MKRFIFIAFILLSFVGHAQLDSLPKFTIGVRVGASLSNMIYTDKSYQYYEQSPLIGPEVGLYMRTRLGKHWALRSDLSFTRRGASMQWCDVDYQFSPYYIDLRAPLQYNFLIKHKRISPYFLFGPSLNYAIAGDIHYASNQIPATDYPMTKGSLSPLDVAAVVGIGFDWTCFINYRPYIFTLEAMYHLGLMDNYGANETSGNVPILNPESGFQGNTGQRHHHGLNIALCFNIPNYRSPIPHIDSADMTWIHEKVDSVDVNYDSINMLAKTYVDSVEALPKLPPEYVHKDCYTIDDIFNMLEEEVSVENLRMCLFDIKFAFDSYELTRGSEMKLNKIVELLRLYPEMMIMVYGHTDSYGSDEYNDKLSHNRALSVSAYLFTKGISSGRVTYKGMGEKMPIDTNETDEGRYHNRRVEIEILHMGPRRTGK